jgi:hypothetical protein
MKSTRYASALSRNFHASEIVWGLLAADGGGWRGREARVEDRGAIKALNFKKTQMSNKEAQGESGRALTTWEKRVAAFLSGPTLNL